jgi:hypothetical protein
MVRALCRPYIPCRCDGYVVTKYGAIVFHNTVSKGRSCEP